MSEPHEHAGAPAAGFGQALEAMANQLHGLAQAQNRGDLAALRRIDPGQPSAGAFLRLLGRAVPDHLVGRADLDAGAPGSTFDMIRRWAVMAQIMAQRPEALARNGLGQALHEVGLTEHRLAMLLNARGPTLHDLARRTGRRLARDAAKLPYRELGRLVLLDGRNDAETESIRIGIARDFHRANRAAGKKAD